MKEVHVLWTGGWDSTFRVLWLALVEGAIVQPHYLISRERRSTDYEIQAIDTIRREALARGGRINSPRVVDSSTVEVDKETKNKCEELKRLYGIGTQYSWLSVYPGLAGIERIELCVHVDDKLYAAVVSRRRQKDHQMQNGSMAPESVLDRFSFPVLELSKIDMLDEATKYGFADLMAKTWFCHYPTSLGKPCGICFPCVSTRKEGLGYRVSWGGVVRGAIIPRLSPWLPKQVRRFAEWQLEKLG